MSNIFIFTWGGKKSQRQLAEDITLWYINEKLPRYKNLNIEIDLEKIDDVQGYCVEIDKRTFSVVIDKRLQGDDFITCLFHELTHVEQHLRNKFGIREDNDNIHYLDRLYEIDAYTKQEQLLEEYRLCS
tara:strand:+ start:100 stop:486 length:387 start_codon:yes stop_codon:yes gene_type:complete